VVLPLPSVDDVVHRVSSLLRTSGSGMSKEKDWLTATHFDDVAIPDLDMLVIHIRAADLLDSQQGALTVAVLHAHLATRFCHGTGVMPQVACKCWTAAMNTGVC
jgi:hypothetical protein